MKIDRSALIEAVARKMCGDIDPDAPCLPPDVALVTAYGGAKLLPPTSTPLWCNYVVPSAYAVDAVLAVMGDIVDG